MKSGVRWGMVTFSLGIAAGVFGHYLPTEDAVPVIFAVIAMGSVRGALVISERETRG